MIKSITDNRSGMRLFYTIRSDKKATANKENDNEKLLALVEYVLLVFLITFIPALIRLGRPPANIEEIWVELLVAVLAAIFGYIRIKGIDLGGGST